MPEKKGPPGRQEYKGGYGKLVMMGTKQKVRGWRGELYVAMIEYGDRENPKFDVVPDSTHPADVENLPEVKTFDNKSEAMQYLLELDRNKDKWKK